jgi:hypothetical protein
MSISHLLSPSVNGAARGLGFLLGGSGFPQLLPQQPLEDVTHVGSLAGAMDLEFQSAISVRHNDVGEPEILDQ